MTIRPPPPDTVQRLLIVMPSWLGDTVMATPTLRALRSLYPHAHITALIRRNLKRIIADGPWLNRIVTYQTRPTAARNADRTVSLARRLRTGRFDLAVILPNSFRVALLARLAGIPRRIGYAREGRGWLLTDRLAPPRRAGKLVPISTRDYYLNIARHLGAANPDPAMQLFTRPEDNAKAEALLRAAGPAPGSGLSKKPLVLINPGANYGDAKIWYPERFAAVADRCSAELGCAVAISGAPNERPILDRVLAAARRPIIDLPRRGLDLSLLKSIVTRAALMVTNDTGPRHIAAAMGVPVVTIFGPTDPAWTEIQFPLERQVFIKVPCGPCQLKKCPLDHRCMTGIDADMVFARAAELLALAKRPSG